MKRKLIFNPFLTNIYKCSNVYYINRALIRIRNEKNPNKHNFIQKLSISVLTQKKYSLKNIYISLREHVGYTLCISTVHSNKKKLVR